MRKIGPHYIISVLAIGGIVFASLANQALRPIEEFVLFGSEKVYIAQDAQSLRGSVGSNGIIQIAERAKVEGDVLGKEVRLAENAEIASNVFAEDLKLADGAIILGTSSTDISFPIAQIPEVPNFTFGNQDINIAPDSEATIPVGSFRDVKIGPRARVVFTGETYNFRSLWAGERSILIFEASSTVNIAETFGFNKEVLLSPKNNDILPENIIFQTPTKKNINIASGINAAFRLITPNAKVLIGADSLIRGNVWAKEVFVGERGVLRDTLWFSIPSKEEDFVKKNGVGVRFVVNVIEVNFVDAATPDDAERIAQLLGGRIVGFGPITNLYAIEIPTRTISELDDAINTLRNLNDPKIEGVFEAVELPLIPIL